jgi:hypothetical protein
MDTSCENARTDAVFAENMAVPGMTTKKSARQMSAGMQAEKLNECVWLMGNFFFQDVSISLGKVFLQTTYVTGLPAVTVFSGCQCYLRLYGYLKCVSTSAGFKVRGKGPNKKVFSGRKHFPSG